MEIERHESECELIEFTCEYCKIVYKQCDASERHTDMICLKEQFRQHQHQSQAEINQVKEELEKLRHDHHILTVRLNELRELPCK
jgi:predicted nuclease with TOPRIM domain